MAFRFPPTHPLQHAAVRPAAYPVARMRRVFHSRAHFRTARTAQLAHAMCMTQPFGFAQRADISAQSQFRDLRFIKQPPCRPIFGNRASAHLQSARHAPTPYKRIRPVFHSGQTFPHNHSFAIYASLSSHTVALFSATARASAHSQSVRHAPTHAKRILPVFHSGQTFPRNHNFAIYASLSSRPVARFSAISLPRTCNQRAIIAPQMNALSRFPTSPRHSFP